MHARTHAPPPLRRRAWPRPGLVLVSCSAPTCVTCGFHGPASAVESGGRLERAGAAALPPWQATPLTALLPSSFNSATPQRQPAPAQPRR